MSYAKQMMDAYKHPVHVDPGLLVAAIDAASDCAQACTADTDADCRVCAEACRRCDRACRALLDAWP